MRAITAELEGTETPVKFIVNVGDNFYPAGVGSKNDAVWRHEWGDIYHGLPPMKWYGTYGNHDYGQLNRQCICSVGEDVPGTKCAQVQKHGAKLNDQTWHMPSMNYYEAPLPGVNLEIVSLDTNVLDAHKICPWIECGCAKCPCPQDFEPVEGAAGRRQLDEEVRRRLEAQIGGRDAGVRRQLAGWLGRCSAWDCRQTLEKRAEAGFKLLEERIQAAEATDRQLIVVTHYPTTWFRYGAPRYNGKTHLDLLKNPRVKIAYFAGHVHSTDNKTNVNPSMRRHGWNDYCVGGGGGWACDDAHTGVSQGVVVGEVMSNGKVVNLRFEMVPDRDCCFWNPHGGKVKNSRTGEWVKPEELEAAILASRTSPPPPG